MTELEVLELMFVGKKTIRVIADKDQFWMIDNRKCTRAVAALIKKKQVWTHYPVGSASAGINEIGIHRLRIAITNGSYPGNLVREQFLDDALPPEK